MVSDNKYTENKQAFYHLGICCRYVAEKFGHADIFLWANGDYIKLSGVLSRQTDVHISPNTLKRIFGKLKTTDRYYPQKATRDTLARYAGYTDWEVFILQHPRPVMQIKQPEQIPELVDIKREIVADQNVLKKKNRAVLLLLLLIPLLVMIVAVSLFYRERKAALTNLAGVRLICNNPVGTNPHSAIFRLQLPAGFQEQGGGFMINFGDGRKSKSISTLKPLTHYYEIPGRFFASLTYNNIVMDTVPVYLQTDGWTATVHIQNDSTRVFPVPSQSLLKNGHLRVNTTELFHSGVDTNRTFFVHFVNDIPIDISGDNFELITDITTSAERAGVRCSQVDISIYGERSKHLLRIMKPGCSSFNGIHFSENILNGESEDLSALGADLSKGGTCKLLVNNRKGTLWINNKQVFSSGYKVPVGKIYGIEILFSGIGEVSSVALRDVKTGKMFQGIY
jgi:hypothetical protein